MKQSEVKTTDMIYVLEDDGSIRNLMLYTLRTAGYEAEGFPDSAPFWKAVEERSPELVLLDIMLPGEDGLSVLQKLRDNRRMAELPVIMATAKGSEYDKVFGLDLGADDYLVKPFGMLEMVSRVRAVLRRADRTEKAAALLRLGELELNTATHTVTVQGEPVQLTLKEYELLRRFLAEPGRVFTRDELLSEIWEIDTAVETRTVDVHIRTLRSKLGPCMEYIGTVRGVGYKIEAEP